MRFQRPTDLKAISQLVLQCSESRARARWLPWEMEARYGFAEDARGRQSTQQGQELRGTDAMPCVLEVAFFFFFKHLY